MARIRRPTDGTPTPDEAQIAMLKRRGIAVGSVEGAVESVKRYEDDYAIDRGMRSVNPSVVGGHKQGEVEMVQTRVEVCNRRLVRVIIADRDRRVPVDKSVLFDSGAAGFMTDRTDDEVLLSLKGPNGESLQDLVDGHNQFRGTVIDKEKDRLVEKMVYLNGDLEISDLIVGVVRLL
jgi:hypothetical protein